MKLKLKLDKKTILDFFLNNVEKIVLGVVALIFVMMLYKSLSSAGRYEKTPEQMQTAVNTARTDVQATTFADYVANLQANAPAADPPATPSDSAEGSTAAPAATNNKTLTVPDYIGRAKQSRVKIEEKPYVTPIAFDPRLFPKSPLRDAPPLLAVQQLRCAGAVGAFRTTSATREEQPTRTGRSERGRDETIMVSSSAEQLRAKPWIVVTGLVPVQKQELAYADAFKQSLGYDPQNDYPKYLGYWVERVEIDGSNEASPDWSKAKTFISRKAIDGAIQEWGAANPAEVVAPEYIEETLTFPLGPLVNRTWDATVAHEPEIPIQTTATSGTTGGMPGVMRAMPGGIPGMGLLPGRMPSLMGGPLRMPAGGTGAPRTGRTNDSAADTPFGDKSDTETKTEDATAASEQDKGPPAYKLFRFFDFDVQPGKRYMYRVRLALANPNYEMKTSYLNNADLAKDKFLKTNWSEPSTVIAAPRDTRVFLASIKPGRGSSEPSAELLLTTWVQRKGVEIYKEFTVTRGQVANYSDESGKSIGGGEGSSPHAGPIMGLMPPLGHGASEGTAREGGGNRTSPASDRSRTRTRDAAPTRGPGAGAGGPAPGALGGLLGAPGLLRGPTMAPPSSSAGTSGTFKADFNSNQLTIDLRGGQRLSGRGNNTINAPGQILLLDPDGYLMVRDELDDHPKLEEIKGPERATTEGHGAPAASGATPAPATRSRTSGLERF